MIKYFIQSNKNIDFACIYTSFINCSSVQLLIFIIYIYRPCMFVIYIQVLKLLERHDKINNSKMEKYCNNTFTSYCTNYIQVGKYPFDQCICCSYHCSLSEGKSSSIITYVSKVFRKIKLNSIFYFIFVYILTTMLSSYSLKSLRAQ